MTDYHITVAYKGEPVSSRVCLEGELADALEEVYWLSDQHRRRSGRVGSDRLTVTTLETGAIRWSTEGGHSWTIEEKKVY
jgi:hypothetical protein